MVAAPPTADATSGAVPRAVGPFKVLRRALAAIAVTTAMLHGAVPGVASGADRPVQPSDLLRLRTVDSIDVSRDGRQAVWTVRSSSPGEWRGDDETYAIRSNLWFADLFDDPPTLRQLTYGAATDSAPTISPDGTRVAFVRTPAGAGAARGAGAGGQIHVLDLAGGEARQVTALPYGASDPRWSPDGRTIAFLAPVPIGELPGVPSWPAERPMRAWNDEPLTGTADAPPADAVSASPDGGAAERRAWLARRAAALDPQVITRLDFIDDRGLRGPMRFVQVFLVDVVVDGAEPRRVTSAFADHREAVFMPDGERLLYRVAPTEVHPDRTRESEIRSIRVDGSDERVVLRRDGWSFVDPVPSRDGSAIAFRARQVDQPSYRQWMLGVVATPQRSDGRRDADFEVPGDPIMLTARLDRSVRRFAWHGTDGLAFTVADRGAFPLIAVKPTVPDPADLVRTVDGMPAGVHAFGAGSGTIVYARTTATQPSVLMVRDARGDRRLVDLNPWTAERWLSQPIERWIVRPDGSRVQSWVMEPRRVRRTERHPALLLIHGGPNAMWGPGELSMWHEMQTLAGAGYGIVYANPRGSGGYGYEFERANRQDWGPGPAGDVLAALDAAMGLEWVDRGRLGVAGGSYGGFLTVWILTRDARFRAAVADRGVYDLDAFFGEGSAWRLVEQAFGGNPYDARVRDLLDRHRPMLDARRIRTPLLLMHGNSDRRTGYVQSEMLYRALKSLDRPVEYVRYPSADHDMSRRGDLLQRIDRIVRTLEFFDRHLGTP